MHVVALYNGYRCTGRVIAPSQPSPYDRPSERSFDHARCVQRHEVLVLEDGDVVVSWNIVDCVEGGCWLFESCSCLIVNVMLIYI